jgi:hypothetical protein
MVHALLSLLADMNGKGMARAQIPGVCELCVALVWNFMASYAHCSGAPALKLTSDVVCEVDRVFCALTLPCQDNLVCQGFVVVRASQSCESLIHEGDDAAELAMQTHMRERHDELIFPPR